jgi:hypothetical protein
MIRQYLLYPLIPFTAPISYIFREQVQKTKGFLWFFLSDDNMYGDVDWRPNLKSKFLRAYLWMLRNPLQNLYWRGYVKGVESDYIGYCKDKYARDSYIQWRTMYCKETGNWHGRKLDLIRSPLGIQNIKFKYNREDGVVLDQYRRSMCIPVKVLCWVILIKNRIGYENGLFQSNFTFPIYKLNREDWSVWKMRNWKTFFLG